MSKGPQKRVRMQQAPGKDFTRFGFGIVPISNDDWDARNSAIKVVEAIISSKEMPKSTPETLESFSVVKGMFSRIFVGDCYDWFSTSRMLGHPSAELSRSLAVNLGEMREAIKRYGQDESFNEINAARFARNCDAFHADCGMEMLDSYIDVAINKQFPQREDGWAYIMWSSSEKDAFHIGAAGGTIDEVAARLNSENPEHHPYGVMAAWLVHDPLAAFNDIQKKFSRSALGDGFYRIVLGEAVSDLEELLKTTDNYVLSPWHVEDDAQDENPKLKF